MDFEDLFEPLDSMPSDSDRERALAAIVAAEVGWKPGKTRSFGDIRWRPDLERTKRVLLLALTGEIPGALMTRLRHAKENGFAVTVALGSRSIEIGTLNQIQALDARIIEVEWEVEEVRIASYRSIADWIAMERISLSPSDLSELAGSRFAAALDEPGTVRGRLYEETLCLVFSQVPWLTVDKHAYRNASEEIDLVLGVHATGHVAALVGGAVAIATAKNEASPAGSATVKYLKEQMANRKDRCQLGFLCSATTISADAKTEILRGSQRGGVVIAELDGTALRSLIDRADGLDEGLQGIIRNAIAA